ncbi:hypothetical protein ACLPJK_26110 [Pseudomonas aeruginosa]|uniref:hypothetical protein n=1 Tax=Pseudomonas aeruginosa TaxID=287 RepID=UPI003D2DA16C
MSETTTLPTKATISTYACGGGGINIVSAMLKDLGDVPGHAILRPVYVDTSYSNMDLVTDENQIFFIKPAEEGNNLTEGSGQIRATNDQRIREELPRLFKQHPPEQLSIIVTTLGGGTGSTAAPHIAREILSRGLDVIVIGIGIETSGRTADNTYKTVKGFDRFSKLTKRTIPFCYSYVNSETSRSVADKNCQFLISAIAVLASRQHKELDIRDVSNFLNFERPTGFEPQLALLKIFTDASEVPRLAPEAISQAAVLRDVDQPTPELFTNYHPIGYHRPGVDIHNLYYTIETEDLRPLQQRLKAMVSHADEVKASHRDGPSFADDDDIVSETGLIL